MYTQCMHIRNEKNEDSQFLRVCFSLSAFYSYIFQLKTQIIMAKERIFIQIHKQETARLRKVSVVALLSKKSSPFQYDFLFVVLFFLEMVEVQYDFKCWIWLVNLCVGSWCWSLFFYIFSPIMSQLCSNLCVCFIWYIADSSAETVKNFFFPISLFCSILRFQFVGITYIESQDGILKNPKKYKRGALNKRLGDI